ncbi:HNH endonuclease [Hymenobacter puniceus]|uniref:HNH endonuclease n=1 Tax=Hymenobacter sp. BT190 TaxID=2763505 RepID=UPI001651A8F7|nr:HNH endonuclease [Hymenobacter sp. BT190]
MLPDFVTSVNTWVEITSSNHGHGGPGWEFGTCLWSPRVDESGAKRYQVMLQPQVGDLVLHFYKHNWDGGAAHTQLCGFSSVKATCRVISTPPPSPGRWVAPEYYRIDLTDYQAFEKRLTPENLNKHPEYLARILSEMTPIRPDRYPFASYRTGIRITQGQYLTRCTALLYDVFLDALGLEAKAKTAIDSERNNQEFQEGKRRLRESYFFTRNPRLASEAKRLRNYICEVCSFDFRRHYGELGSGYAECHHKNPLSERPEELWTEGVMTSVEDVAVLCANCHRMIHSKRPALSIEKLKQIWQAAPEHLRRVNAEF